MRRSPWPSRLFWIAVLAAAAGLTWLGWQQQKDCEARGGHWSGPHKRCEYPRVG